MRLSELGEFGLLRELERRGLAQRIDERRAPVPPDLVVTQDALVEGVHFRLDWTSWRDLGYKAAAVNISDLAASGAEPEALIVSLGLPGESEVADVVELYEGIAEAGVPVLGGDTTSADRLYLSVTALGRAERVPGRTAPDPATCSSSPARSAPRPPASTACESGIESRSPARTCARRYAWRGAELARSAHAMLDISDGLASDALRIAERSGCRLVVELEQVPVAKGVAEVAAPSSATSTRSPAPSARTTSCWPPFPGGGGRALHRDRSLRGGRGRRVPLGRRAGGAIRLGSLHARRLTAGRRAVR